MMHLDVVDADKPRHVVHAQGRKLGVTAPCDPFDWRHSHRAAPGGSPLHGATFDEQDAALASTPP